MNSRFLIFFFFLPAFCWADGAWFRTPEELKPMLSDLNFPPESAIVKTVIFDNKGKIGKRLFDKQLKALCAMKKTDITAWVTHRLSEKEIIKPEAGATLAAELNALLPLGCFRAVELDLEPLNGAEGWFLSFLRNLRLYLDRKFPLRVAIPTVSNRPEMSKTTWTTAEAMAVLEIVDGLDLMVYDTGAKSQKEYALSVQEALFFAGSALAASPGKSIVMGLPAYQDDTWRHRPGAENIEVAVPVFKQFPRVLRPLCPLGFRVSYYAGWTMTKSEKEQVEIFQKWRREFCASTIPKAADPDQ